MERMNASSTAPNFNSRCGVQVPPPPRACSAVAPSCACNFPPLSGAGQRAQIRLDPPPGPRLAARRGRDCQSQRPTGVAHRHYPRGRATVTPPPSNRVQCAHPPLSAGTPRPAPRPRPARRCPAVSPAPLRAPPRAARAPAPPPSPPTPPHLPLLSCAPPRRWWRRRAARAGACRGGHATHPLSTCFGVLVLAPAVAVAREAPEPPPSVAHPPRPHVARCRRRSGGGGALPIPPSRRSGLHGPRLLRDGGRRPRGAVPPPPPQAGIPHPVRRVAPPPVTTAAQAACGRLPAEGEGRPRPYVATLPLRVRL